MQFTVRMIVVRNENRLGAILLIYEHLLDRTNISRACVCRNLFWTDSLASLSSFNASRLSRIQVLLLFNSKLLLSSRKFNTV
jgi:hypothetical protein